MAPLPDFALERYFARWEFAVRHTLGSSDIEGWRMDELLALADDEGRQQWADLTLGYTESLGSPALRQAITSLYASVSPEQIVTFAGAEEAIYAFMRVALSAGDHALVTWPAYQSLHAVGRAAGADVGLVELRADEDWRLDVDRVRRLLRPTTRLIVVNSPHNPTGAQLASADLTALVELAREAGALLFSDEVYRFAEFDPVDRLPAAADLAPHAVSLGVMSKAFGLAGLRIGWLACQDDGLRTRVAAYKDYLSICGSAPSEALATIALRARDRVLARNMALVNGNLALVDAFMASQADVLQWVRPRAGTVGFPRLRADWSAPEFCEALIQEESVLLLPGHVFGHAGNHVRLGFGRRDLPAALERLQGYLARRR